MTPIRFFLVSLLFALNAWSMSVSQAAGDYNIAGCMGQSKGTDLDYCIFDGVKITSDQKDASLVQFEFFQGTYSMMKFKANFAHAAALASDLNQNSQKLSLQSVDHDVVSQTSIERLGVYELLKFSSHGNGVDFDFSLILKGK